MEDGIADGPSLFVIVGPFEGNDDGVLVMLMN